MFSKRAEQINYARVEGIEHKELPAAIVFAAIYVPLLCLCIFYSLRSTYVYKSLTLFSLSKPPYIIRLFYVTHDGYSSSQSRRLRHAGRVGRERNRRKQHQSCSCPNGHLQHRVLRPTLLGVWLGARSVRPSTALYATKAHVNCPRYAMLIPAKGKGAGGLTFLKGLLRNRMLFRAAVTAAIVLGIIGGVRP